MNRTNTTRAFEVTIATIALAVLGLTPVVAQRESRATASRGDRAVTIATRAGDSSSSTAEDARADRALAEKLDPQLIQAGHVKAVINGEAVPTTKGSAVKQASLGAVFIERARATTAVVAAPAVLQASPAGGTSQSATLLRDEIVVANGDTPTPVRSKVYLRNIAGLTYSGARRAFEGQIGVAFTNADADADRSTLPRAVSVLVQAPGASVSPQPLQVLQFGEWYQVKLSVESPQSPYRVAVTANPSEPGDEVTVSVVRPVVTMVPATRRIVGYGIGQAVIYVSVDKISDPAGTQIIVDTDRGQLDSSVLTLDAQGKGNVSLRSGGMGLARLHPTGPYDSAPIEIEFASPALFIGLAALGGVVGAFLQKKGRGRWVSRLTVAAVAAVVMTVAYAVGLDWVVRATGWTALAGSGEAVVFVLGFLGARVGVGVLTPAA